MKLGLLTAAFPDLTLEQVADWAGASGFETLEIACWPAGGGEQRRYAGVSHIDVERLDAAGAAAIRELLAARGLEISSLAYYPNHLHPDPAHRAEVNAHLDRVVDAAALLGVEVVGTFVGADPARSLTENLRAFAEVWPRDGRPRARQGRQDRDRELPDAVLGRRVAVRHQPRAHAAHLARDVQRHPRRRLRPQPRSVAPRVADDRLRARRLRLRRPHPARARQGHGDRPRRALRARRAVGRA